MFTRNTPTKLITVEVRSNTSQAERSSVDWLSCYSQYEQLSATRIHFPPMIPTPVKEPNTVYTYLKSLDKTFRERLREKNAVVTFDEGIYYVAKRILVAISPGLSNVIVRHERFHQAKNFLSVVGKRVTVSGVEDLWIKSDICGSNVATKIIRTHYNRAIRAHKLTLEALERLQWNTFMEWLEKNGKMDEKEMICLKEKKEKLLSLFQQGHASVLKQ